MEEEDLFDDLKRDLGEEAADRLVDLYSGANLYIPQKIKIKRKHQKIREEFKNGASYRELAQRYGYSVAHIRWIIHRKRFGSSSKKTT